MCHVIFHCTEELTTSQKEKERTKVDPYKTIFTHFCIFVYIVFNISGLELKEYDMN
jgi:hypothetical protein